MTDFKACNFYEAVKAFESLQNRYRSFGAADTEPNAAFKVLMRKAVNVGEWPDEISPCYWELYGNKPGWEDVADQLTNAAEGVYTIMMNSPFADVMDTAKYYGWWAHEEW